ncbi:MAG: exonuclease [Candidatus Omnitrophica bacterium]|nr:exonuclease [Candidatus Omnitrophota bacterium]
MLSLGSAAFTAGKELVSTFSVNLAELPGAGQDPDTMQWWKSRTKAWEEARKNPQDPEKAMNEYVQWIHSLPGKPVFVAYPASFDFLFVLWYLMKFTGESPFSYVALDVKSYAAAVLKMPFLKVTKSTMPKEWFDQNRKTHVALDDAIEQGQLFCNMLAKNKA